jgi:hypothetical protein
MKHHTVYVYAECCARGGDVYQPDTYHGESKPPHKNADLTRWGSGTERQLIEQARADLDTTSAGHAYKRRCARNVLKHFGASEAPRYRVRGDFEVQVESDINEAREIAQAVMAHNGELTARIEDYDTGRHVETVTRDLFPDVDEFLSRESRPGMDWGDSIYPGWDRPFTAKSILDYAKWLEKEAPIAWGGESAAGAATIAEGFRAIVHNAKIPGGYDPMWVRL